MNCRHEHSSLLISRDSNCSLLLFCSYEIFADTSFLPLSFFEICRMELPSLFINWDLNCWLLLFSAHWKFELSRILLWKLLGERTVDRTEIVILRSDSDISSGEKVRTALRWKCDSSEHQEKWLMLYHQKWLMFIIRISCSSELFIMFITPENHVHHTGKKFSKEILKRKK